MTHMKTVFLLAAALLLLAQTAAVRADTQSGENVKWQVIAAGGTHGTSTNYALAGTAGQTGIGRGSSTNFGLTQGFWQQLAAACSDCGDANSDGAIDIADAVFLISYIFKGGPTPGDCNYAVGKGDANGDKAVDIADAVYLISYIFKGGPTPHCGVV
jgi:hypothetical protein